MKQLAVVIVNYNSTDYLRKCLESVRSQTRTPRLQVVVVDNASSDADWDSFRIRYPDTLFILNTDNLGFSAACNQGIRACQADYYLLLNPDTVILESAIDKTLRFLAAQPQVGIVGCRVRNQDGSLQRASRRSIPTPATALYRLVGLSRLFPRSRRLAVYNLTYLDEDQSHPVEAVSGSFLMFRRQLLQDIGGLDEAFFLYGEDLDFCRRATEKGWRVYYFAGADVLHFKRRSSSRHARDANRHFYQAMKIFYRKHQAPRSNWLTNTIVLAGIDLLSVARRIQHRISGKQEVGSKE